MKQGALLRQANMITHHILKELESEKATYINTVAESENCIMKAFKDITIATEQTEPSTLTSSAFTASQNVNLEILEILQEMKGTLRSVGSNSNGNSGGVGNRNRNSGGRKRKNTSKYCWSHGACAHDSKDCKSKKPGHCDEATHANKMGGSKKNCANDN